jgi:hypothetical protein
MQRGKKWVLKYNNDDDDDQMPGSTLTLVVNDDDQCQDQPWHWSPMTTNVRINPGIGH